MNNAAYSIYDILRELISRVAWADDSQRVAAMDSVRAAEAVNLWGNYATMVVCKHERVTHRYNGRSECNDCGKYLD